MYSLAEKSPMYNLCVSRTTCVKHLLQCLKFWIGGLEVMQPGVEVGWGWGAEGLQACWAAVGLRTGLQQGMLDL